MISVCFHGAESTGKSVLAARLSKQFGWQIVAEFGRTYCETLFSLRGNTALTMGDLEAIAAGQDAAMRSALRRPRAEVLLLDTDPLMTAAWAAMLFDEIPPAMLEYAKADRYLLFAPDVPWVEDGSRLFGTTETRARFAALAEEVLVRAGVPFTRIGGDWDAREAAVLAAISDSSLSPAGS